MPASILPTSNFQPVIISYKYEIKTKAFSQMYFSPVNLGWKRDERISYDGR